MRPKEALTVAIDGPAGAGKSTVAREVARRLKLTLVDTGAIYRTVGLVATRKQIAFDDDKALKPLVLDLPIHFAFDGENNRTFLDNEDVTDSIRTSAISRAAADVSSRAVVRAGLLSLQRALAGSYGAVLEGRDIGTVVCPEAPLKFFLEASIEARAKRRHDEQVLRGEPSSFEDVLAELYGRDEKDKNREHAPLRAANDAVTLDSTHLTADAVIATIEMTARLWLAEAESAAFWAVALAQRLANRIPVMPGPSRPKSRTEQVILAVAPTADAPPPTCLTWKRDLRGAWVQTDAPSSDAVSIACSLAEAQSLGEKALSERTLNTLSSRFLCAETFDQDLGRAFLESCR